mmetsp:Transcript_1323/g.2310  ORF Transcript_1323/g.2310 Transcript_1323/m.2310 type:complete len:439 (+) Transcript_1323:467-1783(+)|eukprot:CAMPEP_0198199960 /NCGR_PEP_ID=MMETSP1445-20131203/3053_1 /TAXON_ID=36898 /ORGANISM="Pyramimonas sp., Strain CCMP2087" /LENGTH=438 /DNA_ID=CAMNT_0043869875 /DNA_START=461 /DNA_END=1777 /DNA_ORIENTATION=+
MRSFQAQTTLGTSLRVASKSIHTVPNLVRSLRAFVPLRRLKINLPPTTWANREARMMIRGSAMGTETSVAPNESRANRVQADVTLYSAQGAEKKEEEAPGVWFFGYGATMSENVIANRKLKPLATMPARLKNYSLVFDIGNMSDGSAFASVRKSKGSNGGDTEVHGVLYRFTSEDYEKMLRSENALPPADGLLAHDKRTYCAEPVKAQCYGAEGEEVDAFTLLNRRTEEAEAALYWGHGGSDQHTLPEAKLPSWRYLAVMCEGARNLGLDENYTARLARHACIKGSPPLPASKALTNSAKLTENDEKGLRHLTLDELACFDGRLAQSLSVQREGQSLLSSRSSTPIYVACCGHIFDVSKSRQVYQTGFLKGAAGGDISGIMSKFLYIPSVDVDGTLLPRDEDGTTEMQRESNTSMMSMMAARNPLVGMLRVPTGLLDV